MEPEVTTTEVPTKKRRGRQPGFKVKKADASSDPLAALKTQEGQDLIARIVAEATARLTSELSEKRAALGTQTQDGDMKVARALAVAIGEMNDQGSNQKKVPAEEMEKRREAREKMETLILDARANDDAPEYELTGAVYLDEVLVPATYIDNTHIRRRTKIAWPNVPNEHMAPANDVAKAISRAFMRSIGGATLVAQKESTGPLKVREGGLSILHKDAVEKSAPEVGRPRGNDLRVLRRQSEGEIIETNVLGSIAEPARQIS